jgi:lipoprotein signal peptidase
VLRELIVAAGLVVALDQVTKSVVLARFGGAHGSRRTIGWMPRIRPLTSRVFGLRLVGDRNALLALLVLAVLGAIPLTHLIAPAEACGAWVGLGAAIGGATSNLFDEFRRGAVVDFIDLRFCPVFNIADVSILLGILAIGLLIR